ncbi:MAG TPA: YgjV family protein, partial [Chitinophagaceae bacterium]|nr:YgjV family protein [Chitinophagaceae bacterium]
MIEIITQTFGYLASVLLAIALLVNSDVKFRWINSAGCVAFVVYGILLNSIPVALTNGILVVINMITLYKIYKRKENFQLAEC